MLRKSEMQDANRGCVRLYAWKSRLASVFVTHLIEQLLIEV